MFLNLFEENYEKKIWKIEKLDTNRARVVGDLLQIDPIKLSDFSTYSCMYVDEFGERELVFKFDQSLFDDIDSLVYSTRTSLYPKSTRKMQTQEKMSILGFNLSPPGISQTTFLVTLSY